MEESNKLSADTNISTINEKGLLHFLERNGFPYEMQSTILGNIRRLPVRFVLADDSVSMMIEDSQRCIVVGKRKMLVPCSRWIELYDSLKFHAQLANSANTITEFHFLNFSNPIIVGLRDEDGAGISEAIATFKNLTPSGSTPLCRHIESVVFKIKKLRPQLLANNQKAVVTIATDGESTDGNIVDALKPLKKLPVVVVVRLCTNSKDVIDYWNNVDADLDLKIDVLDDCRGEADTVYKYNKWLTYGKPLHRLREIGIRFKELDFLDRGKLSHDQMRSMCALLVSDGKSSELPDPKSDWKAFYDAVQDRVKASPMVYCPRTNKMKPWIHMRHLRNEYGPQRCCSIS